MPVSGAGAVTATSSDPLHRVRQMSHSWLGDTYDASGGTNVSTVAQVIGATSAAATGLDGTGVGVALIDTGVVPVPGLPAAQIVNGPDLSFESQSDKLRYLDTFGHGTHMAGVIVGNDSSVGLKGIATPSALRKWFNSLTLNQLMLYLGIIAAFGVLSLLAANVRGTSAAPFVPSSTGASFKSKRLKPSNSIETPCSTPPCPRTATTSCVCSTSRTPPAGPITPIA